VTENADFLTTVLDNVPLGVAVVDMANRVRYVNTPLTVLLDTPADEMLNHTWDECLAHAAPGQNVSRSADFRLRGRVLSRQTLAFANGERLEVIADVTEARACDDVLRTLFQIWDESMAHAAHELRNPLTAILGYGSLLRDRPTASEEKRRDWANRTVDKGHALRDTIKLFADTNHFLAERQRFVRNSTNVAVLAHEVVAELRPHAGRVIELQTEPAWVTVDAAQIKQALFHLLDNALKYSLPDSVITVRVAQEGDFAVLSVADTGPGITAAYRETIFEPLRRGDPALNHIPGYGLGLSVTRAVAAAHSGTLHVETEPGRGSLFSIRLPLDLGAS
jgi:signal transduction histidine kinase